jgi:NAD(P)H-hydrate epimerase
LNLLAEMPAKSEHRIITPHPGEAGRLLGQPTAAVQNDRRAALQALQDRFGGVAVLKGARTLVSSKKNVPWLCTSGNPGMASPGMGDVLTGIVAALLAQGLDNEASAVVGVEAHGRAGDLAARAGERGTMASDLIAELRNVVNP